MQTKAILSLSSCYIKQINKRWNSNDFNGITVWRGQNDDDDDACTVDALMIKYSHHCQTQKNVRHISPGRHRPPHNAASLLPREKTCVGDGGGVGFSHLRDLVVDHIWEVWDHDGGVVDDHGILGDKDDPTDILRFQRMLCGCERGVRYSMSSLHHLPVFLCGYFHLLCYNTCVCKLLIVLHEKLCIITILSSTDDVWDASVTNIKRQYEYTHMVMRRIPREPRSFLSWNVLQWSAN